VIAMSRQLHQVPQNAGAFQQQTCPDTSTVKTFTPPTTPGRKAHGCIITVETNAARVTFNGDTPAANDGLLVQAAQQPLYLPFAVPFKAVSSIAGNAVVNVTWLS
jgi:hypothetical protein